MKAAISPRFRDAEMERLTAVSAAAASSQNLEEFEVNVLPAVRACFDLSVTSLSNRRAAISEMPDRVVFCGLAPNAQTHYHQYYRWLRNPIRQMVSRPQAARADGILDTQNVFEDPLLREETLYQDFHKPNHMDRALAVVLCSGSTTAMLGLWRSRDTQGFENSDFLKLSVIAPVLIGAYHRLIACSTASIDWLSEILEPADLREALLLVDHDGRIVFANPAARAEFAEAGWQICGDGEHAGSLPPWIAAACGRDHPEPRVWPTATHNGLSARILRIPRGYGGGCLVRLSRIRPERDGRDAPDQRLSERELQVARAVARGLSTKQIAKELAISAFTAQDHIKAIYRKAGVNSRVGLAKLVMQSD